MIVIEGIFYSHSGFSWCDQCKNTVCDGTSISQMYKVCIKGHKYHYGKYMKNGGNAIEIMSMINNSINNSKLFMI